MQTRKRRMPEAWPAWMDEKTLRAYLSLSLHNFRALRAAGMLPQATELVPGLKVWSKKQIDASSDHLFEMTAEKEQQAAEEAAQAALADYKARRQAALSETGRNKAPTK